MDAWENRRTDRACKSDLCGAFQEIGGFTHGGCHLDFSGKEKNMYIPILYANNILNSFDF